MTSSAKHTFEGYTQDDLDEVMDNPPITPEAFAEAVAAKRTLSPAFLASIERRRAARGETKQAVSLRLDQAVIDHFKAGGPGWQTRINEALLKLTRETP